MLLMRSFPRTVFRPVAIMVDAGQEGGGRFVGAAFAAGEFGFSRNEFAPECFGKDGLSHFPGSRGCRRDALFDRICQLEQVLHAADNFLLLGRRTNPHFEPSQLSDVDTRSRSSMHML